MLRPLCLNGVATTYIDIMQYETIVWPENIVTQSHYDVCHIMMFVAYDVCRIMMFVAYDVYHIMMFVTL